MNTGKVLDIIYLILGSLIFSGRSDFPPRFPWLVHHPASPNLNVTGTTR